MKTVAICFWKVLSSLINVVMGSRPGGWRHGPEQSLIIYIIYKLYIWSVKPFETVMVIKGYTKKITELSTLFGTEK